MMSVCECICVCVHAKALVHAELVQSRMHSEQPEQLGTNTHQQKSKMSAAFLHHLQVFGCCKALKSFHHEPTPCVFNVQVYPGTCRLVQFCMQAC